MTGGEAQVGYNCSMRKRIAFEYIQFAWHAIQCLQRTGSTVERV